MKALSFLLAFVIAWFIALPALAQVPSTSNQNIEIGSYSLQPTENGAGYEVADRCPDVTYKRYEELTKCETECDECVLDNEVCWTCKNQEVGEKLGWWQKFKSWVSGIFNPKKKLPPPGSSKQTETKKGGGIIQKIKEIFGGTKTTETPEEPEADQAAVAESSVFKYIDGEAQGEEERIDNEIKEALASAPDMATLIKMQSLFYVYCSEKHGNDYEAIDDCKDDFMKVLRKRGDELKEKMMAEVKESDGSAETYQKMVRLRALLMAGRNASGEGVWFSTENINKVMAGLQEKAQIWLQNALLKADLSNIRFWHRFAQASSKASDSSGAGLFEGSNPMLNVQYRARRLILQKMAEIDICNPTPQQIKELQDLLADPGCEKLLGNKEACSKIASGNLEAAYKRLYDQDKGDEANGMPENEAAEPIDCSKRQTTTLGESDEDQEDQQSTTAEVPNTATETAETPVDDSSAKETQDSPAPAPDPEVAPEEEVESVEPEISPESEPTTPTEPEPEPEPEPEVPLVEPEPLESCTVSIYSDAVIGWNYSVSNCDRSYAEAFSYWPMCGWNPPLVVAEVLEEGTMCYETAGGFVDYSLIIPCYPAPMPDQGAAQCVADQLNLPY